MATWQPLHDATVDDLGYISRSLDCFTSNFSRTMLDTAKVTIDYSVAFDWCHFWWSWMILEGHFTLPRPISQKFYGLHPQKVKSVLLIRNQTSAFRWYKCRWPWRYFKVIKLFHIKFLVNGALYGRSYYKVLIGNHALTFDWCHFWWPWSTFEGHSA